MAIFAATRRKQLSKTPAATSTPKHCSIRTSHAAPSPPFPSGDAPDSDVEEISGPLIDIYTTTAAHRSKPDLAGFRPVEIQPLIKIAADYVKAQMIAAGSYDDYMPPEVRKVRLHELQLIESLCMEAWARDMDDSDPANWFLGDIVPIIITHCIYYSSTAVGFKFPEFFGLPPTGTIAAALTIANHVIHVYMEKGSYVSSEKLSTVSQAGVFEMYRGFLESMAAAKPTRFAAIQASILCHAATKSVGAIQAPVLNAPTPAAINWGPESPKATKATTSIPEHIKMELDTDVKHEDSEQEWGLGQGWNGNGSEQEWGPGQGWNDDRFEGRVEGSGSGMGGIEGGSGGEGDGNGGDGGLSGGEVRLEGGEGGESGFEGGEGGKGGEGGEDGEGVSEDVEDIDNDIGGLELEEIGEIEEIGQIEDIEGDDGDFEPCDGSFQGSDDGEGVREDDEGNGDDWEEFGDEGTE
ncbi:hypothetical protein FRC06_007151 [Ceratobasidium sp. 370]|nr:hypothetical protein FRC06_007151 [Ceratobasidium sp. 370]